VSECTENAIMCCIFFLFDRWMGLCYSGAHQNFNASRPPLQMQQLYNKWGGYQCYFYTRSYLSRHPTYSVAIGRLVYMRHSGGTSNTPLGRIYYTMKRYDIDYLVHDVLDIGIIPSSATWKGVLVKAVLSVEVKRKKVARSLYPSLEAYNLCVGGIQMCVWWEVPMKKPAWRERCRTVVTLADTELTGVLCVTCMSRTQCSISYLGATTLLAGD
jgi:hypothetical protein